MRHLALHFHSANAQYLRTRSTWPKLLVCESCVSAAGHADHAVDRIQSVSKKRRKKNTRNLATKNRFTPCKAELLRVLFLKKQDGTHEPVCKHVPTNTVFDTLVGDTCVGHPCRTHSCRNPLWDTLVHSCRPFL